jgi:hypothetical protein
MSRHKPRLVIVDEHARRDVHRAHQNRAVTELRRRAHALDVLGDVADLVARLRRDREIVGVRRDFAHRSFMLSILYCNPMVRRA